MASPNYSATFERNLGFVTAAQQQKLRAATFLIVGVGGMGGAALETLLRAGVGCFIIADPDHFELHNLNRQVFSSLDNIGQSKVGSTVEQARRINPEAKFEAHERLEGERLQQAIRRANVVINGCDDPRTTIELHRLCEREGKVAIDALAASLPNVVVCLPGSGGIERLLGSPTRGIENLNESQLAAHSQAELKYVMIHSSSSRYVDPEIAKEFLAGKRKRFSFAPMVISTGNLMAFEGIRSVLGIEGGSQNRVYFVNPWTAQIERPRRGLNILIGIWNAWRFLKKLR